MAERQTIDLSGIKDEDTFEPLPKGWYEVVVYEAEEKETSNGDPYLKLRLNVTEEGDYYKRVVFDNFVALYLKDNDPSKGFMLRSAKSLARIAGVWDGEDDELVLPTAEDVEGLEVEVLLGVERDTWAEEKYEEENGEEVEEPIFTNRVKGYRPRGGWPKPDEETPRKSGRTSSITL